MSVYNGQHCYDVKPIVESYSLSLDIVIYNIVILFTKKNKAFKQINIFVETLSSHK